MGSTTTLRRSSIWAQESSRGQDKLFTPTCHARTRRLLIAEYHSAVINQGTCSLLPHHLQIQRRIDFAVSQS